MSQEQKTAREVALTIAGEHDIDCPATKPVEERLSPEKSIPGLYDCECGKDDRVEAIVNAIETAASWATSDDSPLPEDKEILAAHPTRSGEHGLYNKAIRLVEARHSKYGLVGLVNWLLVEGSVANKNGIQFGAKSMRTRAAMVAANAAITTKIDSQLAAYEIHAEILELPIDGSSSNVVTSNSQLQIECQKAIEACDRVGDHLIKLGAALAGLFNAIPEESDETTAETKTNTSDP